MVAAGHGRPLRWVQDGLCEAFGQSFEGDDEMAIRHRPAAMPSLRGSDAAAQPRTSFRIA